MYAKNLTRTLLALAPLLLAAGCGGGEGEADTMALSGMVAIDGSSTVFPISEAMAEEFQIANPGVRVTVGISGTGGGFKKFCAGETDISDASRPIKPSEIEACAANGIEPMEIPVAWDGLTVVRNPSNDWAVCMTVDELARLWQPGSTVQRWSQIRPDWPDEEIVLYGPDTDSGTFDYFTEAIVGQEDASRDDYTASADDNVLVVGVEGDAGSLGYFGFAYYEESSDRLGAVAVDSGSGCVLPSRETIEDGTYSPLSRPMFIYVKPEALAKPQVRAFVKFYLDNAATLVPEVGYVPLAADRYEESLGGLPPEM
ncbi:MAG: PstS family phosphate ABC transporter substrate-binding protein [Candidatus Palauibacterales bacterium]|jgi:phosphate transport system substrate-binding protein|nr:PstS family phosphate ABC transporter substrate-binding protein [Candidatus Palauibacterales bacterium]MDP2482465.1 PstS family phosphate ABC transporter substrate-binding protein [Candidatus Palauibacterales bacterium]